MPRHFASHDATLSLVQLRQTRLDRCIHVMDVEAAALTNLSRFYRGDVDAQGALHTLIETIARLQIQNGKIVIIGVGKSGYVARKLAAMLQSLKLPAVFLHPTEALHGDLGLIGCQDMILFVTHSGKTPEILLLLSHLDDSLPTFVISSHLQRETCEIIKRRPRATLLPAPLLECERTSFGVSAPSSSTAVALAIGDAIAFAAAQEVHQNVAMIFAQNHPGGAIGAAAKQPQTINNICVLLEGIPILEASPDILAIDLLRAGVDSKSGWMRMNIEDDVVSPTKLREVSNADLYRQVKSIPGMITRRQSMVIIFSDTPISLAKKAIFHSDEKPNVCIRDTVIGVVDREGLVGVLEASQLTKY